MVSLNVKDVSEFLFPVLPLKLRDQILLQTSSLCAEEHLFIGVHCCESSVNKTQKVMSCFSNIYLTFS